MTPGAAPGRVTAHHRRSALDRPRGPLPSRFQDTPSLPPAFHATLDAGLAQLGLELPAADRTALEGHARLLLAWTGSINLTAIREPEAVARLHLLDSLSAVPLLRGAGVEALVDIGSGGGFPGLPVAIALDATALLVESVGKKARFLDTAVAALERAGRVQVANARAEALARDPGHREAWPAILGRAVSSLAELAELGLPLLRRDGLLVAWKREPLADELAAAGPLLDALGGDAPEVHPVAVSGLEGHRLVVVRKVRPTPERFPRDPAARR